MQSPLVVEMVPVLLATGAVVLGGRRQSGGGGLYRLLSLLRDWKTDREAARLTNERTAAENDALILLLDESVQAYRQSRDLDPLPPALRHIFLRAALDRGDEISEVREVRP